MSRQKFDLVSINFRVPPTRSELFPSTPDQTSVGVLDTSINKSSKQLISTKSSVIITSDDYADYASDSGIRLARSATWRPKTDARRDQVYRSVRPVNLEKPRQSPQPNGPESSVAVAQAGCQDVNDSQVVSRVQSNKLVTNQEYRTSRELTITSSTSPQLLDSCASTLERYLLALSLAFLLNMA